LCALRARLAAERLCGGANSVQLMLQLAQLFFELSIFTLDGRQ
jgi:hypothetical protein